MAGLLIAIVPFPGDVPPAFSFYEMRWNGGEIELRGFFREVAVANRNPDTPLLYSDRTDLAGGPIGRLLVFSRFGEHLAVDLNAFYTYFVTTGDEIGAFGDKGKGVERSAALVWARRDDPDTDARLGIDHVKMDLSLNSIDVSLGRQPVNLATTFYFTPNDFFAAFRPQTFFRVYKPGVDAARVEIRLGELSLLSIIGVLGYDEDSSEDNGWSRTPASDRASSLARVSTARYGFEWAVLSGTVRGSTVAGGSLQGEIFDWLGIRAEGHYSTPRSGDDDSFGKAALDLEHRFGNSLTVRFEQYYNGDGYHETDQFNERFISEGILELFDARHYTAIDLGYEVSPLLVAEVLTIVNWTDYSTLLSFYSVYSWSDESELSGGISIPVGERSGSSSLESEFGLLPNSISIEFRVFF